MAKAKTKPRPPSPWAGIPPENRPTPERFAKGGQRPIEMGEKKSGRVNARVTVDTRSTPIAWAYSDGAITYRQKDAADRFESLLFLVSTTGGTRDSLDMTPRGGGGEVSDKRLALLIDKQEEFRQVAQWLSPAEMIVLRSVCQMHEPTGKRRPGYVRWQRLISGLNALADFWKVPADPT